MPRKLAGKIALITGAGSGIGAATAHLFAEQGARVALLSSIPEEVAAIADQIEQSGGEVLRLVADVSRPEELTSALEGICARWGRLDILFANAGVNGVWAPIEELTVEEWDSTLKTNLCGSFLTLKFSLPLLKAQGGSVIFTSSINGTRVFNNRGSAAYTASKAGQAALARVAALELAQHRVRVNVICPGWFETRIEQRMERRHLDHLRQHAEYPAGPIPLTGGRPGQPEQAAQLALFLASDDSSHITGSEMYIDGGQSLL